MKNVELYHSGVLKSVIGGSMIILGTMCAFQLKDMGEEYIKQDIQDALDSGKSKEEAEKIATKKAMRRTAISTIGLGASVGFGAHLIADGITDQKLFRITNTTFHITESGHFIKK